MGHIAFLGSLEGTGVETSRRLGLWAENLDDELTLLARAGDQMDVDDGPGIDLRTISRLGLSGKNSFNDLGQLTFQANFTDGSTGIFTSNLVAVPEPSSLLLGLMGIGLVGWYRRR